MDQNRLSALIAGGLARAGGIVGAPYTQYRPTVLMSPLAVPALATVSLVADPDPALTLRGSDYRHGMEATLITDPSVLMLGDYLVGNDTFFVSQLEPLRPATAILCNRTLSILQPASASSAGANGYGGQTSANSTVLASGWPASVLPRTHVELDPTQLPSDVKTAFFDVALPVSLDLVLTFGMGLQDDYGQSYTVSTASLTVGGWRLLAGMQTT